MLHWFHKILSKINCIHPKSSNRQQADKVAKIIHQKAFVT